MKKLYIYAGIAASVLMIVAGLGSVYAGFDGRSTVRDELARENIVGTPDMAKVANEKIDTGQEARDFAAGMREHALVFSSFMVSLVRVGVIAGRLAAESGVKNIEVRIKGPGPGRESAVRALRRYRSQGRPSPWDRDVDDAITMLRFAKQRASGMIEKVIRSAVANANEQEVPQRNTLFVAKAFVDPGPIIKRFQPKDRGKAYPIQKKTSHLVVALDERA